MLPASGVEETIPTWYQVGIYLGSISTTRPHSSRLRSYPLKMKMVCPELNPNIKGHKVPKAGGPDSPCHPYQLSEDPSSLHLWCTDGQLKKEFKSDSGWVGPVCLQAEEDGHTQWWLWNTGVHRRPRKIQSDPEKEQSRRHLISGHRIEL